MFQLLSPHYPLRLFSLPPLLFITSFAAESTTISHHHWMFLTLLLHYSCFGLSHRLLQHSQPHFILSCFFSVYWYVITILLLSTVFFLFLTNCSLAPPDHFHPRSLSEIWVLNSSYLARTCSDLAPFLNIFIHFCTAFATIKLSHPQFRDCNSCKQYGSIN